MTKKYSLTNNKKETAFGTLYQIKAEKSFSNVKKGDLGGWISKEENLSHKGNAWVSGNARVTGNAQVTDDARVTGNAWVIGNAQVSGSALVTDKARVTDDARVTGSAFVTGNAHVYDKLLLSSGEYIGYKGKNENITLIPLGNNYELIATGEVKYEIDDENNNKCEHAHNCNFCPDCGINLKSSSC